MFVYLSINPLSYQETLNIRHGLLCKKILFMFVNFYKAKISIEFDGLLKQNMIMYT